MNLTAELRRSLNIVTEFLMPSRAENRAIPSLDGGLAANDAIDSLRAHWSSTEEEPDDMAPAGEHSVLFTVGRAVHGLDLRSGQTSQVASLPGPASAICADGSGGHFVAVEGEGLHRLTARDGRVTRVSEHPLSCATSLTCVDGSVYVTQGSTGFSAQQWAHDLMSKGASGSLLRIDLSSGRAKTLASGLAWPAGVTAGPTGSTLLVSESWRHRVLTFDLNGGAGRTLLPNLPGYPMRLSPDGRGGYLLAFMALRTHLIDFVLREDYFREEMVRTVPPQFWISPALRSTGERWEPLQIGSMKHLNQTKPWAPSRAYGLLAQMEPDGTFTRSWHARTGSARTGITSAHAVGGRIVMVSKGGRMVLAEQEEPR
ncbi:SMP-30/gluconolactonase/LRE family protein [Streptosporangium sp. NBC_01755]|uniref:SMP-30/gluconolactonase/LRE family protein n=1 Tax=unclassified Streptosporangium TaxID=2632669 RepID=UPI002DDC4ADB|nr:MULTISPECIES: SMP-30/gluconolactonase/LRE family protein [unclassified Streptosporangium]WSA28291.1 SMP-30/gluconolactonase/LRE family protein [Streptosporangium sp. NBC_01810]WSD00232.1 SMP-30/gluconolactonase/LRE family protein [Streptosporangium sp. NBC_01755]